MKSKRHLKILDIINNYSIATQEELLERLICEGFHVTQATVSRDMKELKLLKAQLGDGGYYYTADKSNALGDMEYRFHTIFFEAAEYVDYAVNTVVIKCRTGMANAVCAALDSLKWHGLVGTLAGDDTIFALMRDEQSAGDFCRRLKAFVPDKNSANDIV